MRYPLEPADSEGSKIVIGDDVVFIHASEYLIRGLPTVDQDAICSQVGKVLKVSDIDEDGYAELEFAVQGSTPNRIRSHTIWVEPRYLKKL